MKNVILTLTAVVLGGFLFTAGPAVAHFTFSESGTETSYSCSSAKSGAHNSIGLAAAIVIGEITSRHVGKCEKDGNEYLVDWSVTGFKSFEHVNADHTHTGGSRGDRGGTSNYSN